MLVLILVSIFACVTLLAYCFIPVLHVSANQIMSQSLQQAENYVDSLYLEIQAKQVLYATIVASVAGFMLGLLMTNGAWFMGLMFGVAGYFLPGFYLKLQRRRRREKLNEQIVSAIEMI